MISFKPGDVFVSENPWVIGRAINAVQAFWSRDGKARYGHAGLIISHDGATLEALWRVRSQDIHAAYAGRKVFIARNKTLSLADHWQGLQAIRGKPGNFYPLHRLVFFLFPPLARRVNFFGWTVCSELVAQYLHGAGKLDCWSGVSPDELSEIMRRWKNWQTIYEGVL